jgi:response regulator RpfG family c-di-GMP phosphodiesterase
MRKIHILCVEDEPEVLDAVIRDLSSLESLFPVEAARSVDEARQVIRDIEERKERLGLAICDHIMPGENGVEFLIELYRNPATATARKVLLTGQAGLEATVKAVNDARLDHYIAKPWTKQDLLGTARALLAEYILAYETEFHLYASLLGEERLARAMMGRMPDSR